MSRSIRPVTCVAFLVTAVIASGVTTLASSPQQLAAKSANESSDYVIGAGDVLSIIVYGQDPVLHSGDVVVRPDGKIWRHLIEEVQVSGLTPRELKEALTAAYGKFFKEPTVLLNAKEINSRKVGITGSVHKSGEYALNEEMHIVQLITKAGGLQEYADKKNIRLVRRHPDGTVETIIFNYNKLFEGKGVDHLPLLQPGDQVVVNER